MSNYCLSNIIITARVRSTREGNVLTRVCPSINLSVHRGGYPYPIMLCNISQNAMRRGGTRTPPGGGTRVRYPPWGGYPGQVPPRGGTRVGQQKEYSLHGGRYASCVHAGGLSCSVHVFVGYIMNFMFLISAGFYQFVSFNVATCY